MKFTSPDIDVTPDMPSMGQNREAIRQAGGALLRMGETVKELGETVGKALTERKKIAQQSEFDTMRVSAEQEYIQSIIDLQKENPDSETYAKKAVKNYDDIVNSTLKKSKDPDVQRAFQHAMQLHKLEVLNAVKTQELKIWKDQNISQKMDQIESYKKIAGQTTDPTLYASYKKTIKFVAESTAQFSSEEKARELRDASLREADQANIKTQILDNPMLALKKLDANYYENLDPNDIPYFRNMAEVRIKGFAAEVEDAQVDNIYKKMKGAYGDDYDAIFKNLRDPEFVKRNFGDIDVKVKTRAEQHFAEEQLRYRQAKSDKSDEIAKETSLNLSALTTKDIDQRVANGLDWRLGEHFKNELRNPPEEQQKNPEAYNRMLRRIYEGTESRPEITAAILSEKMPRADKQELLRYAYRDEDRLTDEAVKKADSYLNKYIISKGMLEKALPPEEEALYKAQRGLRQAIEEESKTKKRKLTPEEIGVIAEKIAPIYRKDLAIRMSEFQRKSMEEGAKVKKYMKYKTVDKVKADFTAGKLTRDEAKQILSSRFGVTE